MMLATDTIVERIMEMHTRGLSRKVIASAITAEFHISMGHGYVATIITKHRRGWRPNMDCRKAQAGQGGTTSARVMLRTGTLDYYRERAAGGRNRELMARVLEVVARDDLLAALEVE